MRQTGRTTRQLREAEKGALYICPTYPSVRYTRYLAGGIGRHDLRITTVQRALEDGAGVLHALQPDHVVLDHACWEFMTPEQKEEWRFYERSRKTTSA